MNLPEGTRLQYVISHETWYRRSRKDDSRELNIAAWEPDEGAEWEFTVAETDLGKNIEPAVRLVIFDDALQALVQIPEFFAALAAGGRGMTLQAVIKVLDALGAVDATERVRT